MLDASGQEAARFYFQGTARELDLAITQALGGAGAGAANASTLTTIQYAPSILRSGSARASD